MTRTADVVVIGGRVAGVSIAFHLAARGVRHVLVLERRFIGAGGTGRSIGIVRQLYPTRETSEMVVRSLAVFRDFAEAVGGDAGYVRCGALIAVPPAMRARLEDTVARHRDVGVKAEILEPADVAALEPRLDMEGIAAVLHEPDSGYGDPVSVAAGYADAARRLGVRMSGHGFKLAPAVGETMAALITGARPPVDSAAFRLDRFADGAAAAGFASSYLR